MTPGALSRAVRSRLGTLAGAALLALLVWRLGTGAFLEGLSRIDARTLLVASALGLLTTVLSAWRWCLVARGLGVELPLGSAVADYYRALFLNAALPGGVVGDVHRAVRHGQRTGDVGRGVRAVVLERTAGQVVLIAVAVPVLVFVPSPARAAVGGYAHDVLPVLGALCAAAVVAAVLLRTGAATRRGRRLLTSELREARLGLLARHAWPGVLVSSAVVVAGHLALFLLAARVAGVRAPATQLAPLAILALLAMSLPLNIGGWGPREGVTAWAFGAAGLGASQGLAVAVVYGVLAFVTSLPGIVVLVARWSAGRRRPQIEFEESVGAEGGPAHPRPYGVPHQLGTGEAQPGDTVAEQQGSHGHIEQPQRTLVQEARDRHAAALDQHPAETALGERTHQPVGREAGAVAQGQHLDPVAAGSARRGVLAHHPERRRGPVGEHLAPGGHPAARIEDDPHRVGARAGADGEPGVVGDGRARTDDHRVGQCPQPVQMGAVLLAGDEVGVAGTGRDETVQGLAELCERDLRTGETERQIAVGERLGAGRGGPPAQRPAGRAAPQPGGLGAGLGPDAAQQLPGGGLVEHSAHHVSLPGAASGAGRGK